MNRLIPFALLATLAGCASLPITSNVEAATTATISQAQTDVQHAIDLYGIAKGVAEVAEMADPAIAPALVATTTVLDPQVAKAQTALDDATTDAEALEALASSISQQANALTLSAAPMVTVVPNAPATTG